MLSSNQCQTNFRTTWGSCSHTASMRILRNGLTRRINRPVFPGPTQTRSKTRCFLRTQGIYCAEIWNGYEIDEADWEPREGRLEKSAPTTESLSQTKRRPLGFDEQRQPQAVLPRSTVVLEVAAGLIARGMCNLVVRRRREAVEIAFKPALVSIGVRPPRIHDVGPALKEHSDKFPSGLGKTLPNCLACVVPSAPRESQVSTATKKVRFLPRGFTVRTTPAKR
jgi:hypothetical protein